MSLALLVGNVCLAAQCYNATRGLQCEEHIKYVTAQEEYRLEKKKFDEAEKQEANSWSATINRWAQKALSFGIGGTGLVTGAYLAPSLTALAGPCGVAAYLISYFAAAYSYFPGEHVPPETCDQYDEGWASVARLAIVVYVLVLVASLLGWFADFCCADDKLVYQ